MFLFFNVFIILCFQLHGLQSIKVGCNVSDVLGRMGTEVTVVWFWCHPGVYLEVLRAVTKRPQSG